MSQENVEIVRTLAAGFQHRQHEQAFEFYEAELALSLERSSDGASFPTSNRLSKPPGCGSQRCPD